MSNSTTMRCRLEKKRFEVASHDELKRKLMTIEKKYDHQFKVVFDAIRELMNPPVPTKRKIGFNN